MSRNAKPGEELKRAKSPEVAKRDHEDIVNNINNAMKDEIKVKFNLNKTLDVPFIPGMGPDSDRSHS